MGSLIYLWSSPWFLTAMDDTLSYDPYAEIYGTNPSSNVKAALPLNVHEAKAVSTVCTCVLQLLILLLAGCQRCRSWWLGCQLTWWHCTPKAESTSRSNGESHDLMLLVIQKTLDPRLPLAALSELVFSLDRALLSRMVVPSVCFLVTLWWALWCILWW